MIGVVVATVRGKIPAMLLYVTSTSSMMIGIGAQSIGFIVMARYLGTEQYGHLTMITAVTALGAQWCGLGGVEAMRRRVARDPALYPAMLGHALILILGSGAVLSAALITGMALFVRIAPDPMENLQILTIIIPCNLMLNAWIVLTEQIFLARWEYARANVVNAGFGVARALAAVAAFVGFGVHSLHDWALWHGAVYAGASIGCAAAVWSYGAPRWRLVREELPLGVTICISGFLSALRQNVDLLALSVVATPAVVGAYGVARRIIGTAVVTGASFDRLVYSKLAAAGRGGAAATLRLATRYLAYAVMLAVATSAALFLVAPLLPWLFGRDFGAAVDMVRILCGTLVFVAVQFIAFDALNAADHHRTRLIAGGGASIAGAALIFGLTQLYGLSGTYVAAYLSEALIAAALWVSLKRLGHHARSSGRPAEG
jgi:O-antigen/teichoic acid export membrane protein